MHNNLIVFLKISCFITEVRQRIQQHSNLHPVWECWACIPQQRWAESLGSCISPSGSTNTLRKFIKDFLSTDCCEMCLIFFWARNVFELCTVTYSMKNKKWEEESNIIFALYHKIRILVFVLKQKIQLIWNVAIIAEIAWEL